MMHSSKNIRIRGVATSVLIGALLLAPSGAAGQQGETLAARQQESTLAPRLDSLAQRVQDLTGHFRQMGAAVEKNPELQEQQGWGGPRALGWTVGLGALVGAMTQQAEALARHLEEARSAGDLSELPEMQRRLERLRGHIAELTEALEGMTSELDGMRGTVHGEEGH